MFIIYYFSIAEPYDGPGMFKLVDSENDAQELILAEAQEEAYDTFYWAFQMEDMELNEALELAEETFFSYGENMFYDEVEDCRKK